MRQRLLGVGLSMPRHRGNVFPGRLPCHLIIAFVMCVKAASASVLTTGDVTPADDPFSLDINEGLPVDGNTINPFEEADHQTFFEGRHDDGADPIDPGDDTNENENIIVGTTDFGALLISGESALRYMNLIIGDQGMRPDGQMRNGNGVVRITGFGSLFNNDFNIIPPGLPTDFSSANPRSAEGGIDGFDGAEEGFDLIVGRWGTGTLEISAGARAEIHDAVIVGDMPGSVGEIIVDGFDSFLGSGGFEVSAGDVPHQVRIGRQGIGTMTISNGGTVVSETVASAAGGGQIDTIGAVIGGETYTTTEPETGGRGVVNVLGPGSQWIIGGTLQIGGFHETAGGLFSDDSGVTAEYDSTVGRGTLVVADGALVSIRNAIDADPEQDQLRLVMGRFGRLELAGGNVIIGDPGQDPDGRQETVALVNDGVITGGGRIDTGRFRNRYFGEVRIGAGQKLLVDSTSEFRLGSAPEDVPMINFGLMEVVGTQDARAEIEFERAPNTPQDPIQPFINRTAPVPSPLATFEGGLISAQHATLRFRSGIRNEGSMIFAAGDNIVTGRVDNVTGPNRNGLFYVAPGATVVVEDEFASGGIGPDTPEENPALPILRVDAGGSLLVADAKSLTIAGNLEMEVSFSNPSRIQVAGDLGVNANLLLSFASDAITTLGHGDVFELITFAGDVGGVNFADPSILAPDLATNPVLNVITDAAFDTLFPTLDLIAMPVLQSYYLFVLDPTMVGPGGGGAMGADFNGDGVVDAADLAIWQMNVGISMGASVLQGDADGDGDVDGDDFLLWQQQIGPVPGSGVGSGQNLPSAVPEPSAAMLLVAASVLAFAVRRGRNRC